MPTSQSPPNSHSQSPPDDSQLRERVSVAFGKLVDSAAELNAVSDELAKPISAIETALQKLNLGVSAWAEVDGNVDGNTGRFWDRSIGYAKVSGKWGIAIRSRTGDFEDVYEEAWRFSDAPRSYRLEALGKLPELLDQLVKATGETASALKSKVAATKEVATVVGELAPSARARRK